MAIEPKQPLLENPPLPEDIAKGIYILLAVVVVIVVVYYAYKSIKKPSSSGNSSQTAEDIRNAFSSSGTTSPLSYSPPMTETASIPTPTIPPIPAPTSLPTPTYPSSVKGVITPRADNSPLASVPNEAVSPYNNPEQGFSINLPPNWEVDEPNSRNGKTVFANSVNKNLAYVETYPNSSGETLSSLADVLSGSPDVYNLKSTTIDGQPGLVYLSNRQSSSGIATIYKNKIYYLHNAFLNSDLLNNFHFN